MSSIFEKWNKELDVKGLAQDVKEVEENGGVGTYEEVPAGKYEIKIDKMELKESKKGDPMFSCWMKILEGKHKDQLLFMNQVINQGFQIGVVNTFLRSLDVCECEFVNYVQFNELIQDIYEQCDGKLEFLLDYSVSKRGYPQFKIEEVYEV